MDGSRDGRRPAGSSYKQPDDIVPEFVSAPPFGDPECFPHVDVLPVRDTLAAGVDAFRAARGLPPISASAFRVRRANRHRMVAAEFIRRGREGRDASNDELCRSVQDAVDTGVPGSCAYCGCNFSVVSVRETVELGRFCGSCFQPFRAHQPTPMVRPPAAPDQEERFKGWTPW